MIISFGKTARRFRPPTCTSKLAHAALRQCRAAALKLPRMGLEVQLITAALIRPLTECINCLCLASVSSVQGGRGEEEVGSRRRSEKGGGRRRWRSEEVGVGFMPSSTLANEASDFFSVANQLAGLPPSTTRDSSPHPPPSLQPLPPTRRRRLPPPLFSSLFSAAFLSSIRGV